MNDLDIFDLDNLPRDGACSEVDPELFFPHKGESSKPAITICRTCDVRTICLTGAIERGEKFGIWGARSFGKVADLA